MRANRTGSKIIRFICILSKDGKNHLIKGNFMGLNDMAKPAEKWYGISREEAEAMYDAVKHKIFFVSLAYCL